MKRIKKNLENIKKNIKNIARLTSFKLSLSLLLGRFKKGVKDDLCNSNFFLKKNLYLSSSDKIFLKFINFF